MKDEVFGQSTISIPIGTPPDQPQWQVLTGDAIPAELQTFYSNTVVMVQMWRQDSNDYAFDALIYDGVEVSKTTGRSVAGSIEEIYRVRGSALTAGLYYGYRNPPPNVINVGTDVVWTAGSTQSGSLSILDADPVIPFGIDGISADRGPRGYVVVTSGTSGWYGFVHAEVMRISSMKFRAGRAYLVEVEADIEGDTNSNQAEFKIWLNAIGGAAIRNGGASFPMSAAAGIGSTCKCSTIVTRSGSDVTYDVIWSMAALIAGNVRYASAASRQAYMRVTDIGSSGSFIGALAI